MEKLTEMQLNERLKNRSEKLYIAVQTALESLNYYQAELDPETLNQFLLMLDAERAAQIRASFLQMNNDEENYQIYLIENDFDKTSLRFSTEEGSSHKVILIEHAIDIPGDIFIEDRVTLIVTADIKARNIIVNGSLYTSGDLSCGVLFGASSNDGETYIGNNIKTILIAENGHYTVAECEIQSQYLMSFHNIIEGKSGKFIEKISLERANEMDYLNPQILDIRGYFDEASFFQYISNHTVDSLFL